MKVLLQFLVIVLFNSHSSVIHRIGAISSTAVFCEQCMERRPHVAFWSVEQKFAVAAFRKKKKAVTPSQKKLLWPHLGTTSGVVAGFLGWDVWSCGRISTFRRTVMFLLSR
jgi:hypothetical protein